ncbi:MAG: UTP--glucose-1-phosphate uridylyltransferase GalU [Pseudomonadota bacterium]
MSRKIRKAVIPAAGLGTRFLPETKVIPKEMMPVVDRPVIQYAIEEGRAAGIEQFTIVTSKGKTVMEDHFDQHFELEETLRARGKSEALAEIESSNLESGKFAFVRQSNPLGLGHAIWCARQVIGDEPFAIMLPDDVFLSKTPVLKQMVDAYDQHGGNVVGVIDVPREKTASYGILDVEHDDGKLASVRGLVEKPAPEVAPSTLSIVGRYILQPEVFDYLAAFEKGAGNEIQLTDAMAKLIGSQPFHGLRFEGARYDCGDKAGFVAANLAFALERPDIGDKVMSMIQQLTRSNDAA